MNLTLDEFKSYLGRDGKPLVKGIAIGHCVRGDDWEDRHVGRELGGKREHAHAHYQVGDQYRGWICVREIADLGRDGRVSGTLMHELAHLISKTGHNDAWRRAMARLGQFVGPHWRRRPRGTQA